jgi:hypothetical protein
VQLGKVDTLYPVVVVKVLRIHPTAIYWGHADATLFVGNARGPKIADLDPVDRLDGEVVLREAIGGCVVQDVRFLVDILVFIPLDVSDGSCDCVGHCCGVRKMIAVEFRKGRGGG